CDTTGQAPGRSGGRWPSRGRPAGFGRVAQGPQQVGRPHGHRFFAGGGAGGERLVDQVPQRLADRYAAALRLGHDPVRLLWPEPAAQGHHRAGGRRVVDDRVRPVARLQGPQRLVPVCLLHHSPLSVLFVIAVTSSSSSQRPPTTRYSSSASSASSTASQPASVSAATWSTAPRCRRTRGGGAEVSTHTASRQLTSAAFSAS